MLAHNRNHFHSLLKWRVNPLKHSALKRSNQWLTAKRYDPKSPKIGVQKPQKIQKVSAHSAQPLAKFWADWEHF
jgi:hypothetical protein